MGQSPEPPTLPPNGPTAANKGRSTLENCAFLTVSFVASRGLLWDSDRVYVPTQRLVMASLSSTLRTTIVAVGVIAASLSFIAPAAASAASPHHAKSHRRLCDSRTEARRALARAFRHAPPHPVVVVHKVTTRVQRGLPLLHAREDVAAIQNDGVAIYAEPDRLRSTLQPSWLLAVTQDLLPRNQRFSRRSPRGPPVFG